MADLATLVRTFKGDIVTPTDPDYAQAIARWAVNAERHAKIVAFVKDAADVALAIAYAKATKLPIAVRGGGHSPAGASSIQDGLVIDLSRYINGARADPEKRIVYVGGGALWEIVDREAIAHGLATVAGTVNHTGVGGLLLGGGFGWLSAAHGLVIDNLVQATVVTADGSVCTASTTEHPDLFFGIRGGGSNFGVAVEFVLKLHPQRRTVYAGTLIFEPHSLERLVQTTVEWWPHVGEKEGMLHVPTTGPDGNPIIVVYLFYNGTEAEGRANYKAFLDLGHVADTTREMPYEELNALQNPSTPHGQGVYWKGSAHRKPDYKSIARAFEKAIEARKTKGFKASIVFEYFPLAKINAVPNGTTAFRREPTPSVMAAIAWKDNTEENTDLARAFAREIAEIISGGQPEVTASQGLGYSNYDPEAVTNEKDAVLDKAKLVFAENYSKLQKIKKRYDPENIFNKWLPITPA